MDDTKKLIAPLESFGYIYDKGASSSERYFFRKGKPTRFHLSLTDGTVFFWKRQILFRDYLINHSALAKEYETLKLELIRKDPAAGQKYTDGKNEFVNKILTLAEVKA